MAAAVYGLAGIFSLTGLEVVGLLVPVAAMAVGARLLRVSTVMHVEFVWWSWLATPLLRRVVDLHTGWHPASPVMLVPLLVAVTALPTVVRHWRGTPRAYRGAPVVLAAVVVFATGVGVLRHGPLPAVAAAAQWTAPVVTGLLVAQTGSRTAWARQRFLGTLLASVFVLGAYGIAQFLSPPAWDVAWMTTAPMSSIGLPEPLQVRVFSTVNSPFPFGVVMACLLLATVDVRTAWKTLAFTGGYLALGLSLVRAAWLGLLAGLATLLTGPRRRVTAGGIVVLFILAALIVVLETPLGRPMVERVEQSLMFTADTSFRDRVAFHRQMLPEILRWPVGVGLGGTGTAAQLSAVGRFTTFDSGLLNALFLFGPALGTVVLVAFVSAWWRVVRSASDDPSAWPLAAAMVPVLATMPFDQSSLGLPAAVFWLLWGLAAADGAGPGASQRRDEDRAVRVRQPADPESGRTFSDEPVAVHP